MEITKFTENGEGKRVVAANSADARRIRDFLKDFEKSATFGKEERLFFPSPRRAGWDEVWKGQVEGKGSAVKSDGVFLTPGPYVGFLRAGETELRIEPRISFGYLLDLHYYSKTKIIRDSEPSGVGVLPIAKTLDTELSAGLRLGPLMGYRTVIETSSEFRGRLRIGDQLKRRFMHFPPFEVQYPELTTDIPENQILAAAVDHVLDWLRNGTGEKNGDELIQSLTRSKNALGEVASVDPQRLPKWKPTHLNERFSYALVLSELILRGQVYENPRHEDPSTDCQSFFVRPWEIFEAAVARATSEMHGMKVEAQVERDLFLDGSDNRRMTPDIVLRWGKRGQEKVCVLDTKYRASKTAKQTSNRLNTYKNGEIYQVAYYARALGAGQALLLYVGDSTKTRSHTTPSGDLVIHLGSVPTAGTVKDFVESVQAVVEGVRGGERLQLH